VVVVVVVVVVMVVIMVVVVVVVVFIMDVRRGGVGLRIKAAGGGTAVQRSVGQQGETPQHPRAAPTNQPTAQNPPQKTPNTLPSHPHVNAAGVHPLQGDVFALLLGAAKAVGEDVGPIGVWGWGLGVGGWGWGLGVWVWVWVVVGGGGGWLNAGCACGVQ